jgi:hypothetical protein
VSGGAGPEGPSCACLVCGSKFLLDDQDEDDDEDEDEDEDEDDEQHRLSESDSSVDDE